MVAIVSGRYKGHTGVVDSAVKRTADYPDDQSPGYHVVLENERVVTVRWNQVSGVHRGAAAIAAITRLFKK